MHPVIATSLAAELDRLADTVRRDWAWPAPGAGFACWLFHERGVPALFAQPRIEDLGIDGERLSEAPVLAAYGYLLSLQKNPHQDLSQVWSAGVKRLLERDPLPGDRASFFFRPTELLGLAQGATAIAAYDPQPLHWLRRVLRDGQDRLATDTWSLVLNTLARSVLAEPAGRGHVGSLADSSAIELAALWLLAVGSPQAAATVGLEQSTDALESLLLHRIATTSTPNADIAEAAVAYVAATSAVHTGLAHSGHGHAAALATVTGVLRRFPAIVRELAKRHGKRSSLVKIKDEYDVQDVLRGVLCGLFNDVRDEENTPSHAGLRSRMDLLLKQEQIVIETKMTRQNLDQRGVAEELAIDKELYRSHPDCRTLVCFVYDPGRRLANPTALENDLTDMNGPVPTVVIVAPNT